MNKNKILQKIAKWSFSVFMGFFGIEIIAISLVLIIFLGTTVNKTDCDYTTPETENIEFLIPIIEEKMEKYNIPEEYKTTIFAQLHQESGDNEEILNSDPFQSSESLCGMIGCITDPEKSVDQAMKIHSQNIKKFEEMDLLGDEEATILQSYNFGSGYMDYLYEEEEIYSLETAKNFSIKMTTDYPEYGEVCSLDPEGKACYGDYYYVEHVHQKGGYVCSDIVGEGKLSTLPEKKGTYIISQDYGIQENGSWHDGYDIVGADGAIIYAAGDGEVVFSGVEPLGANVVQIDNGNGIYTSYAHLKYPSELKVGDKVVAGDVLGYQGNSGNSTGSHLHFEVRVKPGFEVGQEYTNNPQDYLPLEENSKH